MEEENNEESTKATPPPSKQKTFSKILVQNFLAIKKKEANSKKLEKKSFSTPKKESSKLSKSPNSSKNNVTSKKTKEPKDIDISLSISEKLKLLEEVSNRKAEIESQREAYNNRLPCEMPRKEQEQSKCKHAKPTAAASRSNQSCQKSDETDILSCCSGTCSNSDLRNTSLEVVISLKLNEAKNNTDRDSCTTESRRKSTFDLLERNENKVSSFPDEKCDLHDDRRVDETSKYGTYLISKKTLSKKEKIYLRSDIKTEKVQSSSSEYNAKMQARCAIEEKRIKSSAGSTTTCREKDASNSTECIVRKASGSTSNKENEPKSFANPPKSEGRRLSDWTDSSKLTPADERTKSNEPFSPVGYDRRHSSWTGFARRESSLYSRPVQKSLPVYFLKEKSAVLDSIVNQRAPIDVGGSNNVNNFNSKNNVPKIAFVTSANRYGIESLVNRLLKALENGSKNMEEMKPETFSGRKTETIEEMDEFEDDQVEVVPSNGALNKNFNVAAKTSAIKLKGKISKSQDEKEEKESIVSIDEEDSIYWTSEKRSMMPRTSSLLSMASKLSLTESPAISPIKRIDGDSVSFYKGDRKIAKSMMRFTKRAVVNSGISGSYEDFSKTWMNQACINDSNDNFNCVYRNPNIKRKL